MEMVNKVESLIFKQALKYPLIQVMQNKILIINDRCLVDQFTDVFCIVHSTNGEYHVFGKNLRIKEYGDFVLRIESDQITKIEIVGDESEK